MRLLLFPVNDQDLAQASDLLLRHDVLCEHNGLLKQCVGAVGNNVLPVPDPGVAQGSADELEVFGIPVCEYEKLIPLMVFETVKDVMLARLYEKRLGVRPVRGEVPPFTCERALACDENVPVITSRRKTDTERAVRFAVHLTV